VHDGRAITNPAYSKCSAKLGAIMKLYTKKESRKLYSHQAVASVNSDLSSDCLVIGNSMQNLSSKINMIFFDTVTFFSKKKASSGGRC